MIDHSLGRHGSSHDERAYAKHEVHVRDRMSGLLGIAFRAVNKVRTRYRGPSWDWPDGTITRLSYDMRDRALNGVPLGAPLDRLVPFGPAGWVSRYGSNLELYYYRLGLIVNVEDDHVSSFEVVLDPPNHDLEAWHPLSEGRIAVMSLVGKWADLTRSTTDAELVAMFGTRTGDDNPLDDERWDAFETPGHHVSTTRNMRTGSLVTVEIEAARDRAVVS